MKKLINLLPNISHKQKMFINMLIAQIGFLSLTMVMVLFKGDIKIAVTVNGIFAIIIAYLGWAAFNRVHEGIQVFNVKMKHLMDFSFMKINDIPEINYTHNDEIGWILEEFYKYESQFDSHRKEDMKVMGEIVLTLDKMSQGIYTCRVHSDSHNFMIRALRDTINKTLDTNAKNIKNLKNVAEQYANDDFRNKVTIDPKIKADMLAVMTSVNTLGEALSNGAKTNLTN
ncbi:MAG: methyl-accepting chemotaxis protein, partial [Campylobacterota bacterium]|nr:methyl-accepting chemotaxis protein [Campylobacterota bacterium]